LLAVLAPGISKTSLSKEKRRSDNLLLNILPREVADELKQSGRARARHYPQVTILFIDIVGFTQKAEVLDPEELVAEINLCFEAFDELVTTHGKSRLKPSAMPIWQPGGSC
jgi:Adenylate cyclase, family 3 (some proteins contain HAMP domain)